ncbi:hypothetical protein SAMN04487995_0609 [Dyadobacter koreensis]|uniref:DUF6265 domain-containing protein n=1 Tax=Dyadobacter koreensis TaxID=408657 RepID=A0A1H6QFM5_9BACT|nr:DUF6265 family protein [Dyadobacter koreensis]SEI42478.1 hypothetical protein SAMN04487995_0609 [Dyadobacter koreensis]
MILIIKPIFARLCLALLILFSCAYQTQAQGSSFSKMDFRQLHNLLGVWKTEKKNGTLFESWDKAGSNLLAGKSFKIVSGDTIVLERVRLAQEENLRIVYAVRVDGQNNGEETLFYLKKVTGSDYIFENLQHDFPKRIVYTIPKNNMLHAYIEGEIQGKTQRSDFNYIRVVFKTK